MAVQGGLSVKNKNSEVKIIIKGELRYRQKLLI